MQTREAETLMCPFGQKCIHEQCMAWRWYIEEQEIRRSDGYGAYVKGKSRTDGYCGLVGAEVCVSKPVIKQCL